VGAPRLDDRRRGDDAVAVDLERAGQVDGRAVGALEVAQRDDVAVALLEVLPGRMKRLRSAFDAAPESSSAQISCRCPESASITTAG
jgi:hypothetical protein